MVTDVPACFACKTFFRRAIVTSRNRQPCRNGERCDILRGTPCKACRFDKCILSGMNPTAMKLPKNLNINLIINKINKRKRVLLSTDYPTDENKDTDFSLSVIAEKSLMFEQTRDQRDIEFLVFLETRMTKLRESDYSPTSYYNKTISSVLEKDTALRLCYKYSKPDSWPVKYNYDAPAMYLKSISIEKHWFSTDLILCIEMAKLIPTFEKLELPDKVYFHYFSLIKKSCRKQ